MSPQPTDLPERRTDAGTGTAPFGGGNRRDDAAVLALASLVRGEVVQIVSAIAASASAALAVDRVTFWHYDRQRSVMICGAAWARGVIVQEPIVLSRDAHPECWHGLHAARSLAISDTRDHPLLRPIQAGYVQRHGIGAMLGSSVRIDGGALGFLAIEHLGDARQWTALEERYVHELADRLGLEILVQAQRRLDSHAVQARRMDALALMAGRIAHDFNNQLSVILSSAGAARALLRRDDARIVPDLDAIEQAVQQATALTRKLVYLGRRDTATRETFDLNDALRRFVDANEPPVPEDIRVEVLASAHPLLLHAERSFVEQALQTLRTTAVGSMPAGGTLTFATRRITVDGTRLMHGVALPAGTYAHLRVLDTGEGIPAHALSRVFDPFYSTRGRGHAGLGLALIYGGMRQHGGAIGVESVEGRGTVFHLFFAEEGGSR